MSKSEVKRQAAMQEEEPAPPPALPKPVIGRGEVGYVHFQDVDGGDGGWAIYHTPMAMRERTLQWRHRLHEQNHQLGDGTWVYRLTSTSGIGHEERDERLEPCDPPVKVDA